MKKLFILTGLITFFICFLPMAIGASEGELVVINTTDAISMDPLAEWVTDGMVMMKQMYDHLVDFDETGKIRFQLATSYKVIDDKTWQFKLRQGVKFHNGDPFTAADAKFTIDRILDPKMKCTYRSRYKSFDQIKVVDDYTLEIKTKTPDPTLLNRLGFFVRIVPKRYIEEKGLDYFRQNPIGTGPFKFVKWVPKDSLVLEANEKWWGGIPKVKRLVFRSLPEMSSRLSELQAGGAHIVTAVPAFMVPQLEKDRNITIQSVPSLRNVFFSINTLKEGPLKDKRVRQALNYAVDKEAIIRGIFKGRAIQTPVNVSPFAFGYDESIKPYPYDPEKAKALLKEAGYEKGFKLPVDSPSGRYPNDKEVAGAVNEMLNKVGIETKFVTHESGIFVKKSISRELEGIFLIGLGYLYWDIDTAYSLLDPNMPYCHYHNQDLAKMVEEARSTMDPGLRKTMASKIQKLIHDEAVSLYLYNQVDNYGVSNKVKGFKPRSDDYMDLYNVSLHP